LPVIALTRNVFFIMQNQDLISALVAKNIISDHDAKRLLTESAQLKRDVEDLVYSQNLVEESEVAKIKSGILKIPYKKIDLDTIDDQTIKIIPADTARSYQMIPLSKKDSLLVVGMVHPDNPNAQQALRFLATQQKLSIGVYIVTPSDINAVLRKYSPFADEIESALRALKRKPGEEATTFQQVIKLEEGLSSGANDAPIIRIASSLLKEAVNMEASDIHIEPGRTKTRVRFRIDGDLQEFTALPAELGPAIASRVKVLSNMKLDETRVPQDGRFRTIIFEKEIDFRVATFPTPNGEKIALRVLDPAVGLKDLTDLGIRGKSLEILKSSVNKPYGIVLLTGPTGSGKTTTLYALMRILNTEEVNILSLEDPVEYTIEGINQSQVRPEIGYDFASGLRQILRQDPDVIMVGEIRDSETADLAVHAALTGHIVLSTLHTNNAIGVIPRLVDLGAQPFLLPSAVNAMAAQRLISKICQNCKKPKPAPETLAKIIKEELQKLPPEIRGAYKEPYQLYTTTGCAVCKKKGIVGRIAIFEIYEMTSQLADLMVKPEFNENMILEETRRQGMITLRQDGILKALDGLVNIEDVLKETEEL